MLVPFSKNIPAEALKGDDFYLPFKQFAIEFSEKTLDEKFIKKKKKKNDERKCFVCGMHITSFSQINSKNCEWTCIFCLKNNYFQSKIEEDILKPNYFLKTKQEEEAKTKESLQYFSLTSTLNPVENLIIFVLDCSNLMDKVSLRYDKDDFEYLDGIANFLKKEKIEKFSNIYTKICVILCSTSIKVIGNSEKSLPEILYPKYEDVNYCFEIGSSIACKIFEENDAYENMRKKIRKVELRSLSSIGSGLAIATGILSEIKPIDHKIILIGGSVCCIGALKNYQNASPDEISEKEIDTLMKITKNINEINIMYYDILEENPNFFSDLKTKLKKAKNFRFEKIKEISAEIILDSNRNHEVISIASTENCILNPCESKNYYFGNFTQKNEYVSLIFNKEMKIFPMSFEFAAGKKYPKQIIIQVEVRRKNGDYLETFISAKKFVIDTKYEYNNKLNFSVSNFCYLANDYFKNNEKKKKYEKLLNDYLTSKFAVQSQIQNIINLSDYLSLEKKISFHIKTPIENDLKNYLGSKSNRINNGNNIPDLLTVERL